jgi:putative membrane protein
VCLRLRPRGRVLGRLRLFRSPCRGVPLISHRRYLAVLALAFAPIWIAAAISPVDRKDWALENVLVLVAVAVMAATWRRFPLSRISLTMIFAFLCLHQVGAHYTYAKVPYDAWSVALTGGSLDAALGWERNHFDRFAHFLYGLLLAYPVREVFLRVADARGFWGYFLPLDFVLASSALFELFEWGAAELFGGDLGVAYLGTQGDVWDAHKDMALAALGALIAMAGTALLNWRIQRDFALEMRESLRVKSSAPLGEDEIARLRAAP